MERREFLEWVGTGLTAASLPLAIAACTPRENNNSNSNNPNSSNTLSDLSPTDPDGLMPIGSIPDLNERGFLYNSEAKVIVVRNGATLSALNPTCTHSECPVEWDVAAAMLSCPCHGSKFAADGTVIVGPATENLAKYPQIQEVDDTIFVKLL